MGRSWNIEIAQAQAYLELHPLQLLQRFQHALHASGRGERVPVKWTIPPTTFIQPAQQPCHSLSLAMSARSVSASYIGVYILPGISAVQNNIAIGLFISLASYRSSYICSFVCDVVADD